MGEDEVRKHPGKEAAIKHVEKKAAALRQAEDNTAKKRAEEGAKRIDREGNASFFATEYKSVEQRQHDADEETSRTLAVEEATCMEPRDVVMKQTEEATRTHPEGEASNQRIEEELPREQA